MKFNHRPMTRPAGIIAGIAWNISNAARRWPGHPIYPFIIIGGALAALLLMATYNV